MHHTPVRSPPAVVRTDQDWHYSPRTDTPSGRLLNHPHAPRVETPLLWCEYNNPPVVLQGNPVPAMASPHEHQFAATPPNIFVPPPVVHQPPPPFPIDGHPRAPFAPPPPGPPGGQSYPLPALRARMTPVSQPVIHTRLGVHPTHTTLCSKPHLCPYKMTAILRQ